MSNTNKLIFWGINATAVILLILGAIVATSDLLLPPTVSRVIHPVAGSPVEHSVLQHITMAVEPVKPTQPVKTIAQLEKEIFARIKKETKAQAAMPVRPAQPTQTPAPTQKEEATPLQINASNIGAYVIAGKLIQEYAILQQAPGHDMMPICMQAGAIAQAFLMAQDAERYNEWKARQDFNCKTFTR